MLETILLTLASSPSDTTYDKQGFINLMVERGHNQAYVRESMEHVTLNNRVVELFSPPSISGPNIPYWKRYEAYENKRNIQAYINIAEDFVAANKEALIAAEVQTGVHYNFIAATIVQETLGGIYTGTFPALESLYSQFVGVERRREGRFGAINQADYLFRLARNLEIPAQDLNKILGSYAGAIGMMQFMPEHIVNLTNPQSVDDLYKAEHAIFAVANYYKHHTDSMQTPKTWQDIFGFEEQLDLSWEVDENTDIAYVKASLLYNRSSFGAVFKNKLAHAIGRDEDLIAKMRQERSISYYAYTARCQEQARKATGNITEICTVLENPSVGRPVQEIIQEHNERAWQTFTVPLH